MAKSVKTRLKEWRDAGHSDMHLTTIHQCFMRLTLMEALVFLALLDEQPEMAEEFLTEEKSYV